MHIGDATERVESWKICETREYALAEGALQKIAGICAIQPKSFKPKTTESKHKLGYNENLIMNLKELTQPDRLWVDCCRNRTQYGRCW